MTNETSRNNYAYEIRFVDDNVVQVFDLAAKRKQDATILPFEYKEDDVVKGQLRYSKLVGGTPSTTTRDIFGYEDTDQPYKHHIMTKISKNRKSTQRNTFFMMGGNEHRRYDSGTDVTKEEEEPVDEYYYQSNNQSDMVLPSSPKLSQVPTSTSKHDSLPPPVDHTEIKTPQPAYIYDRHSSIIDTSSEIPIQQPIPKSRDCCCIIS